MNKRTILTTIAIGLFLFCSVLYFGISSRAADVDYTVLSGTTKRLVDVHNGSNADQFHNASVAPYGVFQLGVGLAASTWYCLIDLDDTTNYPHTGTDSILMKGYKANTATSTTKRWDAYFCIVTRIDGSNADCDIIDFFTNGSGVDAINYNAINVYPAAVDLSVTNSTLDYFLTSYADDAIAALTTSTEIASPAGSVAVEVGDLLIHMVELEDTATFTFGVNVYYDTY